MTHQQLGSELSLRRSQRLAASASTQQLQEVKAKLEQCRTELNSTTEGEGEWTGSVTVAQEDLFSKLGPFDTNSNITSLTLSYIPPHLSLQDARALTFYICCKLLLTQLKS